MKLTAQNLDTTIKYCLFKDGEDATEHVYGEGILNKMGFHPERLKEKKEDIRGMLYDLPDGFLESKGGGWSFLNACQTKDDVQWADLHQTMDSLIILGVAAGLVKFLMPRDLWKVMPGGMPYFVVLDKSEQEISVTKKNVEAS